MTPNPHRATPPAPVATRPTMLALAAALATALASAGPAEAGLMNWTPGPPFGGFVQSPPPGPLDGIEIYPGYYWLPGGTFLLGPPPFGIAAIDLGDGRGWIPPGTISFFPGLNTIDIGCGMYWIPPGTITFFPVVNGINLGDGRYWVPPGVFTMGPSAPINSIQVHAFEYALRQLAKTCIFRLSDGTSPNNPIRPGAAADGDCPFPFDDVPTAGSRSPSSATP